MKHASAPKLLYALRTSGEIGSGIDLAISNVVGLESPQTHIIPASSRHGNVGMGFVLVDVAEDDGD
jgi:hypothetical protein